MQSTRLANTLAYAGSLALVKGWSQSDLAKIVGISYAQIGRYETKGTQPSAEVLKKIADAIETTDDAQNIFTAVFPNKVVFIVGNERFGISETVLKLAKHKFFLPVPGPISLLNVSHALAIGLYEWYRQQTHSKQQ